MTEAEKNIPLQLKLAKLMVLSDLLITELEDEELDLKEIGLEVLDKLKAAKPDLLNILEKFYESDFIKKTEFYSVLANQFEYNYKRGFHKYFKIKL